MFAKKSDLALARYGSNEKDLLKIAKKADRKIAYNLARNPHCSAIVLTTARARASLAYNEFVDLELHENYPLNQLSGEGAFARANNSNTIKIQNEASQDVNDNWLKVTYVHGIEVSFDALANPDNSISNSERDYYAQKSRAAAYHAARLGAWPQVKDTRILRDLNEELRGVILEVTPNVELIEKLLYKTPGVLYSDLAALRNEATPNELKNKLRESVSFLQE